jgi:hypothetical protein
MLQAITQPQDLLRQFTRNVLTAQTPDPVQPQVRPSGVVGLLPPRAAENAIPKRRRHALASRAVAIVVRSMPDLALA